MSYPLLYNAVYSRGIPYLAQQPYLLDSVTLATLAFATNPPASSATAVIPQFPYTSTMTIKFQLSWVTDSFF